MKISDLIGIDKTVCRSSIPSVITDINMDEMWDIKTKEWLLSFFGRLGGAKASAYKKALAACWGSQILIGAFMSGGNEDRTESAMDLYKLKSKQKRV